MTPETAISVPPGTRDLLREIGYAGEFTLSPLSGGANNRVYRIDGLETPLVLKSFYEGPGDRRDRFGTEKAFYDFLQVIGLKDATPRSLAWSSVNRLGLYSWVAGKKLIPTEVDENAVRQALNFYLGLNKDRQTAQAQTIPIASEACFTRADHIHSVERRLKRLEQITAHSELELSVVELIKNQMRPALERSFESVENQFAQIEDKPLPTELRVVSPSDFGFHNALRVDEGRLVFFDFEYAGWDDPLKFVCDFLCQPEIPVPPSLRPFCLEMLDASVPGGVDSAQALALLPLYQLKWGCIMLNEFLPTEQQRRIFARDRAPEEIEQRRRQQFEKARGVVERFWKSFE